MVYYRHMLETLTQCATTILIGLACYWLGPLIINWLMTHIFVTHYQRTLHKKDLEKRQRTLGGMFTNVWRIIVVVISLYFILQAVIR